MWDLGLLGRQATTLGSHLHSECGHWGLSLVSLIPPTRAPELSWWAVGLFYGHTQSINQSLYQE